MHPRLALPLCDPGADFWFERRPNGTRLNIGAYGGTPFASLSPTGDEEGPATSPGKKPVTR